MMCYNYFSHRKSGVLFCLHRAVSNERPLSCDKKIGKRWMRLFVGGGDEQQWNRLQGIYNT